MLRKQCKRLVKLYILNTQHISYDFDVVTISYHEVGCKSEDENSGYVEYHCTTTLKDSKYYELIYDKAKKQYKIFTYKLEDSATISDNKF